MVLIITLVYCIKVWIASITDYWISFSYLPLPPPPSSSSSSPPFSPSIYLIYTSIFHILYSHVQWHHMSHKSQISYVLFCVFLFHLTPPYLIFLLLHFHTTFVSSVPIIQYLYWVCYSLVKISNVNFLEEVEFIVSVEV